MAEMISTGAGDIWADDSGGDLTPLLLLHPGVGDSRVWDPVMPSLLKAYRVIRFDARSFGRSPVPTAEFSQLGDALTVLDHFGVARAAVVGYSIGGSTALSLALDEPARVSALVLLCPGASGYPWPDESHEDEEFAEAVERGGVGAVAEWAGKTWAAAGSTPKVVEQLCSAARAWMSGSHRFERDTTPVYERLGAVAVPTSLLVGDLDKPSLLEAAPRLAERIPGCRFIRVPDVDHFPTIRVPDLVVRIVNATVARTRAGAAHRKPIDGALALAANRALWDARARAHGTTPDDVFYDVDSFLAGRQTLSQIELELAGDVSGRDLLHLQCHFGMDTLNWARLGARVTGVDFSPVAIARARKLTARAGLDANFVEADTQNLPCGLADRFDLVLATYGVLCWIADLDAWMGGVVTALRPGGTLVLVDLHPAFQTLTSYEPFVADRLYGGGEPQCEAVSGTYADPDSRMEEREVIQYPHSVGEIVTAAVGAGLVVDRLGEHMEAEFDGRRILPRESDGVYRFPVGGTYFPVLYSLRAVAPQTVAV